MLMTPILALALGMPLIGGKHESATLPSNSDISYIEGKINMPDEASGPLSSYERYYAWTVDNGKKYIHAEYVFGDLLGAAKPDPKGPHVHPVTEDQIPNISNGGCGVIIFYFNPRGDHTPSLYCNPPGPAATP